MSVFIVFYSAYWREAMSLLGRDEVVEVVVVSAAAAISDAVAGAVSAVGGAGGNESLFVSAGATIMTATMKTNAGEMY